MHKFHWPPSQVTQLSREELAFISAAIQVKLDAEKEEEKKMKAKTPHARRRR